jgi:hypothetical protein
VGAAELIGRDSAGDWLYWGAGPQGHGKSVDTRARYASFPSLPFVLYSWEMGRWKGEREVSIHKMKPYMKLREQYYSSIAVLLLLLTGYC